MDEKKKNGAIFPSGICKTDKNGQKKKASLTKLSSRLNIRGNCNSLVH